MSKDDKPQKRRRNNNNNNPTVKTSKALSWALRHAARELGLDMGTDGYVPLQQLLQHRHAKFRGMTLETVQQVVNDNDKQRFALIERDGAWFIRANQGHSIKTIDPLQLLTSIDPTDMTIIHGTYTKVYQQHIKKDGLSKMNRTHIHFAKGLFGEKDVISGMRATCSIYVHIDGRKCAQDGIKFFESANGVILTDGVDGMLAPKYFSKVVDRDGKVLMKGQVTDGKESATTHVS